MSYTIGEEFARGAWNVVGPLTIMITIALILAVFLGAWLIIRASRGGSAERRKFACAKCGQVNPGYAKFCAHCGQAML